MNINVRTSTLILTITILFISCKESKKQTTVSKSQKKESQIKFLNKGHELVYNLTRKVGTYGKLKAQKDVVYTYTYTTPDGKSDISTEKYIFEGELSYGEYKHHQRTLPQFKGTIEQGYDGKGYWIKHNGKLINDSTALKRVAFNRPTNFYWFAMFQKLLDPGLNYNYLGKKSIDGKDYDVVKISFQSKNNTPTDIYQLYINKENGLVDQFLFTVADFGIIETPLLMQIEYEKVNDLLIPSKRKYKKSTWDAVVTDEPWIEVEWSGIKFNNGLTSSDFKK